MDSISQTDPINLSCWKARLNNLVTELWYLHKHVMLYIQKCVSENARDAVIGVEKYETFLGENAPKPLYYHTTPHQTFCHHQPSLISTHQYNILILPLSVDAPSLTDKSLKDLKRALKVSVTNVDWIVLFSCWHETDQENVIITCHGMMS